MPLWRNGSWLSRKSFRAKLAAGEKHIRELAAWNMWKAQGSRRSSADHWSGTGWTVSKIEQVPFYEKNNKADNCLAWQFREKKFPPRGFKLEDRSLAEDKIAWRATTSRTFLRATSEKAHSESLWVPVGKENCSNKLSRQLPPSLFSWAELNIGISRCS